VNIRAVKVLHPLSPFAVFPVEIIVFLHGFTAVAALTHGLEVVVIIK